MQKQQHADQKTPVHLMNAVFAQAEEVSVKEGVSLEEFVNAAVTEKLAQLQHVEWLKQRRIPTKEHLAETRRILRNLGSEPPDPSDELPEGYVMPDLD